MGQYKLVANNKKARHDYFIEDTYEAGLELFGTEVKSIRNGKASIKEAYAEIKDGEMYVKGMNITPYDHGNRFNQDPIRPRKLLLHKREINKLDALRAQDGFTIVPLKLYINNRGLIKLEIAVAKGKKNYDKRQTMAKKDANRKIQQAIKDYNR
ncbi:MAG: SsrA-binding protein [Clostridiales bacterium]|uniref:SsrA-binding protein n=1 Tax=Fusibacter paucivorans TaxID=76009 RepID=A0ABS5PW93_9FIRM|nr:SsrA-binding protein SmpB [Fusibacter paucivorans]MBS7528557.1 SsrA-binding protein SmpB [Fusibacter paucivorans]MDK2866932.1 SsrA-binding protein [Clostridiales bacterium]MDN5299078.1 SsrA-binding protein [Clostridiales bacterium]